MAINIRQIAHGIGTTGTAVSATFASPTVAGNAIVYFHVETTSSLASNITGPAGFTSAGTPAHTAVGLGANAAAFYKLSDGGGNTVYSSVGNNNVAKWIFMVEIQGDAPYTYTTAAYNTATGNNVTQTVSTAADIGTQPQVVLAGFASGANVAVSAFDGAATTTDSQHSPNGDGEMEGFVASSTGIKTLALTLTAGGTSDSYAANILAIAGNTATGGGGGGGGVTLTGLPTIFGVPSIPTMK